ncbi:MAG: HEAT repeat domain-containing protein [Chitinophagales bacterium]|nr:HEAT repeat domain-containing protein [Chitinophagales bacterium]
MLTKDYISELKKNGNGDVGHLVNQYRDAKTITFILESLGQIPSDFDGSFLRDLVNHPNSQVRFWAVKTIGKIDKPIFQTELLKILETETDTTVKREAVSSIGRQRNPQNKPLLFKALEDNDPKIVCQAIRGLFVFENDKEVEDALKPLINHPNEMVRTVIYKEYFAHKTIARDALPHPQTHDFLKNIVVNADVIDALKSVPDESVHLTFTSPPYYNARDYSIYQSYEEYLNFLNDVFKETHRVTKEGRFLIVNTSPIIIPRVSRAHSSKRYGIPFDLHPFLVKNGWEFVDDIVWLKPETSVKNRIGGFMQHRKPLGYKPNAVTEYLMVYRKQTEKLLDWNIRSYEENVVNESKVADGYETTNVWRIDPCFDKIHSAVFPVELCKRVIQYYSYKGDLVFDPFGGSGTVGRTAKSLGRYFFLTEKEPTYFKYMKSKASSKGFFNDIETKFLTLSEFQTIAKV